MALQDEFSRGGKMSLHITVNLSREKRYRSSKVMYLETLLVEGAGCFIPHLMDLLRVNNSGRFVPFSEIAAAFL